jgi:hypothetical protein
VFRITIQVEDNDVIIFLQQPWYVVQVGVGRKLAGHTRLWTSNGSGHRFAAMRFGTNQRNRQDIVAKCAGML